MALRETTVLVEGEPRKVFVCDDPTKFAFMTGPIYGKTEMEDGTVYYVNKDWIEVEARHVGELDHKNSLKHEVQGVPTHVQPGEEGFNPVTDAFIHVCNRLCGRFARTADAHREVLDAWLTANGATDQIGSPDYHKRLGYHGEEHARLMAEPDENLHSMLREHLAPHRPLGTPASEAPRLGGLN